MSALTPTVSSGEAKKIELHARLSAMLTLEQLGQLVEQLEVTLELAVKRKCEHQVIIILSSHGYPTFFNGTNNLRAARPSTYQAE